MQFDGPRLKLWVLLIVFLCWMGGWFWAFSFAYSSSYFSYNLGVRLPFLALALLCVAVPPLSGYRVLTKATGGTWSKTKAFVVNLAVSAAPLVLFAGVYSGIIVVARVMGKPAFEADEAMGIGIGFMLCLFVVIALNLVTLLVLAVIGK